MRTALITTEARSERFSFSVLRVALVRFCIAAVFVVPQSVSACAVCFGNSDSPWAKALNWGILVLLFVVLSVLGGIVAFFMHMAKRSRMAQLPANQEELQP